MNKNSIISLCDPVIGAEEKLALCEVVDSNWITMGERVVEFEKAFAGLHDVENAVAVSSCTAGLHLCLKALNIGPGDEVLVPSLTFVATVNAVLYAGATPVFVDVEQTYLPHISIKDAKVKATSKTKAVIVMHYAGYIADMKAWRLFADEYELVLIEDAAHAPAIEPVGKYSDAAAFSFFSNKNMTTAEGGMVFAAEDKILERVRFMRSHGMTSSTLDRHKGHAFSYDVTMLGYNYRMDEFRAALGLAQLHRLKAWNDYRKKLNDCYRIKLAENIPEISIPFSQDAETTAHIMPILLQEKTDRKKVMSFLRKSGIQSSIHYPPVHNFSYYQKLYPGISLPKTEEFCQRELTLPLHPGMSEDDVDRVVQALNRYFS